MSTLPAGSHEFIQMAEKGALRERATLDGKRSDERVFGSAYLARQHGFVLGVRRGIGFALKQAARLLYLSPFFVVAKFALRVQSPELGDYAIVAFVLTVVAFFALLNIYVLWSAIAWWSGALKGAAYTLLLPFDRDGGDALGLFRAATRGAVSELEQAQPGQRIRVRGVARRLGPDRGEGDLIVTDEWTPETAVRETRAVDFAVQDEHEVPVVVRLTSAPIVLAEPARDDEARAETVSLREGERVELAGVVSAVLSDPRRIELDDGVVRAVRSRKDAESAGAYREAQVGRVLLVTSTPVHPVVITRLAKDA